MGHLRLLVRQNPSKHAGKVNNWLSSSCCAGMEYASIARLNDFLPFFHHLSCSCIIDLDRHLAYCLAR